MSRLAGAIAAVLAICAGTALGLAGTGGTYALWTSQAQIHGGTVQTGSLGIKVSNTGNPTPATSLSLGNLASNLAPGDKVATAFTVTSVGSAPVAVSVKSTSASDTGSGSFAGALAARAAVVGTSADCTTSLSTGTTGALVGFTTPALFTLAPAGTTGDSKIVCLVLTLSTDAPSSAQGLTADFTLTLDGAQATP